MGRMRFLLMALDRYGAVCRAYGGLKKFQHFPYDTKVKFL